MDPKARTSFRYELTAVAVQGPGTTVRSTFCESHIEGAVGVLDGSGAFLLDGDSQLYDAGSLAPREQLHAPGLAHAVFVRGQSCCLHADRQLDRPAAGAVRAIGGLQRTATR